MKIEQTYIYGKKSFFVSTINRADSSMAGYGSLYAETMAWEINPTTNERIEMVQQGESSKDSTATHDRIVKELREKKGQK